MNNRRIKLFSFLLISFGFISGGSLVHAETSDDTSSSEITEMSIRYEAPDMDLSIATDEQRKQLEEIGWNLDTDIPFLISEQENEDQSNNQIHENHNEHNVDAVENNPEDILTVNLSEVFDNHDSQEFADEEDIVNNEPSDSTVSLYAITYGIFKAPAHGTKIYKNGNMVHCNRFNGPKSDGRHLAKTHPQTYINYYKSDCYYGVAKGICKYTGDKCNTSLVYHRGWCSYKQGWSVNYHKR